MEAISGLKTIQEIAADHAIHSIQVSQWKKQLDTYISISRPKAWMPGCLCPAQTLGVSSFWPYQRGQGTGSIPIERVGEGESGMGADGHSLRA